MKRIGILLLSLLLTLALAVPTFAQATKDITVAVDGLPVQFDVKPTVQNGRALVPFRALAEALQVQVTWDGVSKTIRATAGANVTTLQIGNKIALKNGSEVELDVPPQVINGRTLIPLRFFSETFQCQVDWQQGANAINIVSSAQPLAILGYYALGDQQTSSWTDLFGTPFPNVAVGNTDVVDRLALGWYSLDSQGNLLTQSRTGWQRPDDYQQVLIAADRYQLDTEMVVHVTDQDNLLTNLLSNPQASQQAVAAIAAEAVHYQGVNLDFEGLGLSESGAQLTKVRDDFTNFVARLAKELQQSNKQLALSLHAPNSAYQGYDYQRLGQLADTIIVMAYDYGSKPEPLSMVSQAIEQARAVVPANKLMLGVSLPNETATSLPGKIRLAKQHHLKGIALWRLGVVSDEMWQQLRTTVR
ncbi:stalk domain-containing protein [Peptococcaceae bacterium 1198_IL3148]